MAERKASITEIDSCRTSDPPAPSEECISGSEKLTSLKGMFSANARSLQSSSVQQTNLSLNRSKIYLTQGGMVRRVVLGVIAIIHMLLVPFRIGFPMERSAFLIFISILLDTLLLDVPSIYYYLNQEKDVRRRRAKRSKRMSVVPAGVSPEVKAESGLRVACRSLIGAIAVVPVIETIGFVLGVFFLDNQQTGYEIWALCRMVKFLQIGHIFRLRRFVRRSIQSRYPSVNRATIRFGEIFVVVLGISHILGCCWNLFSISDETICPMLHKHRDAGLCPSLSEDALVSTTNITINWSYISTKKCFRSAFLAGWEDEGLTTCGVCGSIFGRYIRAFYWAIMTISTVGFGDITPYSTRESIFVLFSQVVGTALYIILLSDVTSLISNADAARLAYNRKTTKVKAFLSQRNVSKETTALVNGYFDQLWTKHEGFEEADLIKQLPHSLQNYIRSTMFSSNMMECPSFSHCEVDFIERLLQGAKWATYMPNQTMYTVGMSSNAMYGVISGSVELCHVNKVKGEKLHLNCPSSCMFGHYEFLALQQYHCTCKTSTNTVSEIFSISREVYEEVTRHYVIYKMSLKEESEQALSTRSWYMYYQIVSAENLSKNTSDKQKQTSGSDSKKNLQISPRGLTRRATATDMASSLVPAQGSSSEFSRRPSDSKIAVDTPSLPKTLLMGEKHTRLGGGGSRVSGRFSSSANSENSHRKRSVHMVLTHKASIDLSNTPQFHVTTRAQKTEKVALISSVLSVCFTVTYLVLVPLRLAYFGPTGKKLSAIPSYLLDLWFLGELLIHALQVAKKRAQPNKSLILCGLALIPYGIPYFLDEDLDTWSLLRGTRLLRGICIVHYIRRAEHLVEPFIGKLEATTVIHVDFLTMFVVLATWMVSVWTMLCKPQAIADGLGAWGKLDPIVVHSNSTFDSPTFVIFGRAFYWALTAITTVGYGDIAANSSMEMLFCVLGIILGCLILYPAVVANISVLRGGPSDAGDILKAKTGEKSILEARAVGCTTFRTFREKLRQDITSYIEFSKAKEHDIASVLSGMPPWLVERVKSDLYRNIVKNQNRAQDGGLPSPFALSNPFLVDKICFYLKEEMGLATHLLVEEGSKSTTGYFKVTGSVAYSSMSKRAKHEATSSVMVSPRSTRHANVKANRLPFIGLFEILLDEPFKASVRIVEPSTFLCIARKDFLSVLELFPEEKVFLTQKAQVQLNGDESVVEKARRASMSREGALGEPILMPEECESRRVYVIHPHSNTRRILDMVALYFVLHINLLIPLGVGLVTNENCVLRDNQWLIIIVVANAFGDVFCLVDMILHAWFYAKQDTTESERIISKPWQLFRGYIKSNKFKIDLIATFPLDWIVMFAIGGTDFVYISNWLRFVKLVRIFEVELYMKKLHIQIVEKMHVRSNTFQLVKLTTALSVFSHWIACFWIRIGIMGNDSQNWVAQDCVLSGTCFASPCNMTNPPKEVNVCIATAPGPTYLRGLYWVLVTLNTVGLGDIRPSSMSETNFAAVIMVLGAVMYAFLIASIANVVANLDKTATTYKRTQEEVLLFVASRRLPQSLRDKISTYMEQLWREQRGGLLHEVVSFLPGSLRLLILQTLDKGQLSESALFKGMDKQFMRELTSRLSPINFTTGDTVFFAGHPADCLYILFRGFAKVLAEDGKTTVSKHTDKGVFGLEEFYDGGLLHTTLQVTTYSTFLYVNREEFSKVLDIFPDRRAHIELNAVNMKSNSEVLKLAGNLKSRKVTKMMAIEMDTISLSANIIFPASKRRICWDFFMGLMTIYIVFSNPFRLGFFADTKQFKFSDSTGLILWVVFDVLFVTIPGCIDMYLQSRRFTCFREGLIVSHLADIKANYKATWLRIDSLATFPVDLLVLAVAIMLGSDRPFQLWAAARIFTLLRSTRLFAYYIPLVEFHLQENGIQINLGMARIVKRALASFMVVHWVSCAWYGLAIVEGLENSWANTERLNLNLEHEDMTLTEAYVRSVYWGFTVLTTVGYGDIIPLTLNETAYLLVVLLVGLYLYVDLVANVTTYISNHDSDSSKQRTFRTAVRKVFSSRKVHLNVVEALEEYFNSNSLQAKYDVFEDQVLKILPPSISMEVAQFLHGSAIGNDVVFSKLPRCSIPVLAKLLKPRLYLTGDLYCCKGDKVFELGHVYEGKFHMVSLSEIGEEAFVQMQRVLNRIMNNQSIQLQKNSLYQSMSTLVKSELEDRTNALPIKGKVLTPGSVAGYEMLCNERAVHSVFAMEPSEVYLLEFKDYSSFISNYGKYQTDIQLAAIEKYNDYKAEVGFIPLY